MPKFAANLTMLFNEVGFLDRFGEPRRPASRASSSCSRTASTPPRSPTQLDTHKLELVLHNLPAGDWEAGERGIACHPDRMGEFQDGVGQGHRVRQGARRQAAQLPGRHQAGKASPTARRTAPWSTT